MNSVKLEQIKNYWSGKNVPQQWYSDRTPLTLAWFNELRYFRYKLYYEYLNEAAEFKYHSNEKVLEVGCGIGTDLAEYALNGANVSGIDLGNDQIDLTKLNFDLRGLKYELLEVGNAESLQFEDNTFDLVFSFGVLHHTTNPQQAINEIYRVLKPDGKAIIMLYARGWKHYIKRCFIHGILLGKWFKAGFNWKMVYNQVSEVHGNSPKTEIYRKSQLQEMFSNYNSVKLYKKRIGEFFEYPPYRTFAFPKFILRTFLFLGLESLIGENWLIKAHKAAPPPKVTLSKVIFEHY
jgi:ubiquinone/menaquinone biosynthesis C-methylase UbiE